MAPAILTTVVGSYPQPDWLVDRERFKGNVVPRVRLPQVWRVGGAVLGEGEGDGAGLGVGGMGEGGGGGGGRNTWKSRKILFFRLRVLL